MTFTSFTKIRIYSILKHVEPIKFEGFQVTADILLSVTKMMNCDAAAGICQ
jgi:hypothetical protein